MECPKLEGGHLAQGPVMSTRVGPDLLNRVSVPDVTTVFCALIHVQTQEEHRTLR